MSGKLANVQAESAYWYTVAQKRECELSALRRSNEGLVEQIELQSRLIDELRDELVRGLSGPRELAEAS